MIDEFNGFQLGRFTLRVEPAKEKITGGKGRDGLLKGTDSSRKDRLGGGHNSNPKGETSNAGSAGANTKDSSQVYTILLHIQIPPTGYVGLMMQSLQRTLKVPLTVFQLAVVSAVLRYM